MDAKCIAKRLLKTDNRLENEEDVKSSVAEPCHSDTVPVQVPTSYFPSYGPGSLHNLKKFSK